MSEYIEREALRKFAKKTTDSTEVKFTCCYPYWQFNKAINDMPAADVAPVRRGRWRADHGSCVCSECGGAAIGREEDHGGFDNLLTRYCPNCGAKMEDT